MEKLFDDPIETQTPTSDNQSSQLEPLNRTVSNQKSMPGVFVGMSELHVESPVLKKQCLEVLNESRAVGEVVQGTLEVVNDIPTRMIIYWLG